MTHVMAEKAAPTTEIEERTTVYTPAEVSALVLNSIKATRERKGLGIPSYMPALDKYLKPARPGQLLIIMGRPSNYKSGLMQYMARSVALDIIREGAEREIVVYVTWEMPVEDLGLYDLAAQMGVPASQLTEGTIDDDLWQAVQVAAMRRAGLPLWIVGHSVERRRKRPNLTLTNVAMALRWIDDVMGFHPRVVFLDYLQQMQTEHGEDRRMQVFDNVRRSKDMALHLACPVHLGVQAGRQVDDRQWNLPEMGDGQETSNIEQTADVILSVWMPKTTKPAGEMLQMPKGAGGIQIEITDNLLVVGLKKQRTGPANKVCFVYVDHDRNQIHPLQIERLGE